MLISPPFLPPHASDADEMEWIEQAMVGGNGPGKGMFPLSTMGRWHGGLHLTAPAIAGAAGTFEPVRAIADGMLVYKREPTPVSDDLTHPLHYSRLHKTPAWTHDGVVVIKHGTDIGEGDGAGISYYSITQHLSSLDKSLPEVGRRVWRKDKIGTAGSIVGDPNKIHFEIIATQEQVQKICGRTSALLDTSRHGRADVLFGEIYVALPAGTRWMTEVTFPSANGSTTAIDPAGQPGPAVAHTSTEPLYVGLLYRRGSCTVTTYRVDGSVVGESAASDLSEYDLYDASNTRYPQCPIAGFELMRLGRVLHPDHALRPAGAPHWRRANYPGGSAWVNLNAPGLTKFSDADMPHWRGWQMVDDDASPDARCDSAIVKGLLNKHVPKAKLEEFDQIEAALRHVEVRKELRRLVCKFPTEWSESDEKIDKRYGWTRALPERFRMDDEMYAEFNAFVKALGFVEASKLRDLQEDHWHFHPREFIKHFRHCGWLGINELTQFVPVDILRNVGKDFFLESPSPTRAREFLDRQGRYINRMTRRTGINNFKRFAIFFGNSVQETRWFSMFSEANGSFQYYSPWYGRGLLQLTHAANYIDFWKWQGRSIPAALRSQLESARLVAREKRTNSPLDDRNFTLIGEQIKSWRDDVSRPERSDPSDSAGWYWLSNRMATYADETHELERVPVATQPAAKPQPRCYYRSQAFWKASAAANLPAYIGRFYNHALNGFVDRCVAYANALHIAGEVMFPTATGSSIEKPENWVRGTQR